MAIEWMETKLDDEHTLTIIQIDKELEIKVGNIGREEYTLDISVMVAAAARWIPLMNELRANPKFANTKDFWGEALIWANARTIAHLVMDVLMNQ